MVRLLRDAEVQAINLEKVSQEQAEIYNDRIKIRNELKVDIINQLYLNFIQRKVRNTPDEVLPDGRPVITEDKLADILKLKSLKQELTDAEKKFHVSKAKAEYCRDQARKVPL